MTTYGTTYALPVINLHVSAAPSGSQITVTCIASGDFVTIAPATADNLTIDCLNEVITNDSGTDQFGNFIAGRFIRLVGSPINAASGTNNQITVTCTGGATLSSASISFRDRSL